MVAAQSKQLWLWPCLLTDGRWVGAKISEGGSHLLDCEGIVKRRHGYITTIEDGERGCIGVETTARVETSERELASGCCSDSSRSETCT